eukprot:scaffold84898_cov17-Tisochrysis_lutea.AAC.2
MLTFNGVKVRALLPVSCKTLMTMTKRKLVQLAGVISIGVCARFDASKAPLSKRMCMCLCSVCGAQARGSKAGKAQAMDGSMNMETSLDERLKVINCKPEDVRRFVKANPPESRLTPLWARHAKQHRGFHDGNAPFMQGIENLIKLLQRRGVAVYLISVALLGSCTADENGPGYKSDVGNACK